MAGKLIVERVPLQALQRHHHFWLNTFSEHETLIDAISNRPGLFGANPVAYLSLVARRESIRPTDLDEALMTDRFLLRASAFRGSLFLLNTQDYPTYFRTFHHYLFKRGLQKLEEENITKGHLYRFCDLVEAAEFDRPKTVIELADVLFPGKRKRPSNELCYRIVQKLCDMGVLVRAGAKGWKGNDFTYAVLKRWAPEISLKPDNPEVARTETVRRYLRAYGPASMEDIAWWTGLPLIQCQRSVAHLRKEAIRFHVETYRDDMIGLKETVEPLRKKNKVKGAIQLLPPFDPYTLGYACRRRIAAKEHLPYIYDKYGNATSVIVDCGKVIGLWQFRDGKTNLLEFHIFQKYQDVMNTVMQKIDDMLQILTSLTKARYANIVHKPLPEPLKTRAPGSFLWPLGKPLPEKNEMASSIKSPMDRRTSNTFRTSYLDNQYLIKSGNQRVESN